MPEGPWTPVVSLREASQGSGCTEEFLCHISLFSLNPGQARSFSICLLQTGPLEHLGGSRNPSKQRPFLFQKLPPGWLQEVAPWELSSLLPFPGPDVTPAMSTPVLESFGDFLGLFVLRQALIMQPWLELAM